MVLYYQQPQSELGVDAEELAKCRQIGCDFQQRGLPDVQGTYGFEVFVRIFSANSGNYGVHKIASAVRSLFGRSANRAVGDDAVKAEAGLAGDARAVPMGSQRSPMRAVGLQNAPTTIGGRQYTGHALDQMQGRGITPTVVEDTLARGVRTPGRDGATIFTTDQLKVIVNPNGSVKTVYPQ